MPVRRILDIPIAEETVRTRTLTTNRWLADVLAIKTRVPSREAGYILGDPMAEEWKEGYLNIGSEIPPFYFTAEWSKLNEGLLQINFDTDRWYVAEQYPVHFKRSAPRTWRGILLYPPEVSEKMGVDSEILSFTWFADRPQDTKNFKQKAFRIKIGGTHLSRGRPSKW